jgi:hypothetical protein
MAFDPVLTGATANDGTGDPLRTAFTRINDNFDLAVEGAASSTDGTVVQFDGTTGKVVKASSVVVADIIVEGDARLTDSRTPTAHGNEAHTSTFVDATGAAAAAPVQSVNTLTGAVVLDAAAVGADPTGTAASEVSTHNSDTTSVHGIADTATLVVGPASATDNSVAVYDGTTGKLLKDGTGTVTAGKFSPTANTVAGNGVYLPATDAVAISTNGVERLRVLAGGNVGIGTATPARLLDVATDAAIHGIRVGRGAGNQTTNTAVGSNALNANTTGAGDTAVGNNALLNNTTGADNTAVGSQALNANTTGLSNSCIGNGALRFNTTGNFNTAVGASAMFQNVSGIENTALGASALVNNTTGGLNTALGRSAMVNNTAGANNVAAGWNALRENTTSGNNAAHGYEAVRRFVSGTGAQTAVGYRALYGGSATPANNTGGENTAVGHQAGDGITTGSTNTIVGHNAGRSITTGSGNTVLGAGLAGSAALANTVLIGSSGAERLRLSGTESIFGNGDTAASPNAATLRGTNATGTNIAGPNMTIQAGRGTGTGAGGSLSFQTAAAGTTGSTLNAATTRLFINAAGQVGIGTTSPATGLTLDVNGSGEFGTATTSATTYAIFSGLVKNPVAPAGTAVIDIVARNNGGAFPNNFNAGVAEVDIIVASAGNTGQFQASFKYSYLTVTDFTSGGSATLVRMAAATGTITDDVADFAVTRPANRTIRITYTNPNAGNTAILCSVRGVGLGSVTIT